MGGADPKASCCQSEKTNEDHGMVWFHVRVRQLWREVDRKKRSEEKRKLQRKKRKELESLTAMKAFNMLGIGLVDMALMEEHKNEKIPFEKSKLLAVEDLLAKHLEYNREELDELTIVETRLAATGENIIYVAFMDHNQVREVHMQKTELKNDLIMVRNYIPPMFYDRFTYLSSVCRDKRMKDNTLKTQLRFGKWDMEIFVKYRGENTPFRQVRIDDFTDPEEVPAFNHNIKWRRYEDKPPRRRRGNHLNSLQAGQQSDCRDSHQGDFAT